MDAASLGEARPPEAAAHDLALPLDTPADLDPLLDRIGDARYVLLGEASHGTHEYYDWRAAITRRLVTERGFSFVAVEGDWPDCSALDACVRYLPGAPDRPREVLDGFDRWPAWMWANTDVAAFAEWLRGHNATVAPERRVAFYGLDVYSLWASLDAVLSYLVEHEPGHVDAALRAWRCFEPYGEDPGQYARATRLVPMSCEAEVVGLLGDLLRMPSGGGRDDADARFEAEQNAAVVAGAERYYRAMVSGGPESWNVRDVHMAETLDRLVARHGPAAKAVVWAHNTHVGDARATDMAAAGMVNVGQLVRERHAAEGVVIVGFGGYRGSVVAADEWGATPRRMPVPAAAAGSVEALLHRAGCERALFVFPPGASPPGASPPGGGGDWLRTSRDHRAIGVVYRPDLERAGNYVPTILGRRYDAFCFFADTRALQPLHGEPAAGGDAAGGG